MNDTDSSPLLASATVESYDSLESPHEAPKASGCDSQDASVRWRSIRICYMTFFISSLGFSICITAVWPYLQQMDNQADEAFLGWVIAAYSVGQLVASPVLGLLFDAMKQARAPLLLSLACSLAGSLLYVYVQAFPSNRRYALLGARLVIGIGAGNGAVIRSFVSGATTVEERTPVMATVSMAQSLGFIVGPALQAALTSLSFPGPIASPLLPLNVYTSAGWLTFLLGIFNIVVIVVWFKDFFFEERHEQLVNAASVNSEPSGSDDEIRRQLKPDAVPAVVCILAFCVLFLNFSTLETMMTPLSQVMWAWTKEQALLYNGVALAVCGGISLVAFASIRSLVKLVSENDLIVGGLCLTFAAFALLLPWRGPGPPLQASLLENATSSLTAIGGGGGGGGDGGIGVGVGCPQSLSWCRWQPAVRLSLAIAAVVVHSVGYPIALVMISSVISKILGPMRQGKWMGAMASGGSLSRCVGPVAASQIFYLLGTQQLFLTSMSLAAGAVLLVAAMSHRMVPYDVYRMRRQQFSAYTTI